MVEEGDQSSVADALVSARRVYDRQVATLENIDDKAMRTVRTAVLVIGFVAAAITAGGPGAAASLSPLAVLIAALGSAFEFAAAFVGVGIYTVTEYPVEISRGTLDASRQADRDEWTEGALSEIQQATVLVRREVDRNAEFLTISQALLIGGVTLLVISAAMAVINQSYQVEPWKQAVALLILGGFAISVVRVANVK